ncbi:MAG TPA: hypothetical protein VLM76_03225 [Patescibacteria group bacterium]|nr:hypothetical protein [Patescibacteria group bacterium]
MTETLFERYKEALRAGHVATLRGRLEDAVAAYREAISITGDRAVPRTALGTVLLRLGDAQGALDAFDGALALEPGDDASLAGKAQALVVLRRTAEAALAYDALAGIRALQERLADAGEAARRALAIEPTDERRERHARLVAELQAAGASTVADGAAALADGASTGLDLADEAVAADPAPPPAPPPDPEALILAFEEAAARGDAESAAAAALAAARAYRFEGRIAAAFDACLLGIGIRPGHVDVHLLLADLALDRGWTSQAQDAYRQLLRLADLEGDAAAVDLVRRAAAGRLTNSAHLAAD